MRKIIYLFILIGFLAPGSTPIAADDAQGFRNLKLIFNALEDNRQEKLRKERQKEQDRIQREYLLQRKLEIEAQEERNRIERNRIEQERRGAYEKRYWESQKEVVATQTQPPSSPAEKNTQPLINPSSKPVTTPVLSAVVGKIGDDKIIYNVPMGLSWNPNPCIIDKYESVPCESCPTGYKTSVTLQKKEVRNQCWQERPQNGPMGGDKNYQIQRN